MYCLLFPNVCPFFVFSELRRSQTILEETGKTEEEMMESIMSEQSATVDELVEACIQAFGLSLK